MIRSFTLHPRSPGWLEWTDEVERLAAEESGCPPRGLSFRATIDG